MFDYLIKNGQLIDGTGSPARRVDVGITDGKIAAIGDLSAAQAGTVIDAAGKTVTPGFIDIHRHADAALFRPHFGELELKQGLTTIVNGNCGLSVTPCSGPYRREIEAYLAQYRLPYATDLTNLEGDNARAVLRRQVFPLLRQLNPAAAEHMASCAADMRQLGAALSHLAEDYAAAAEDTGAGLLNNVGGQLQANLAAAGVNPDDVDTVLLTHCHPDHIGGLLDAEKRPVYKHAEIILHPLEAQHWQDDKKLKIANERGQRNFGLVRQTLHAYAQNVSFFNGDKIADGILPIWLPGHTPGHTGFRIDSDAQCLLIWGDIVHFPHIQSAQPAVSILFDTDPVLAEETRKKILEKAVREKLLIAGMHLGQAGFANVLSAGSGYRICYSEK